MTEVIKDGLQPRKLGVFDVVNGGRSPFSVTSFNLTLKFTSNIGFKNENYTKIAPPKILFSPHTFPAS